MEEVTETFNVLARTVVDQLLSGAITACERLTQKADGTYVSYMAVELSATELVGKYNERLSKDERIRAEYTQRQRRSRPRWPSSAERLHHLEGSPPQANTDSMN